MNKNSPREYPNENKKGENKDKKELMVTMPLIGNHLSRKEWENICWQKILESKELLQLLVTSYERRNIVMRAAALNAIASGKSYKQIGKEFWLSPQTISAIKKAVNEKSYQSYFNRSKKERKKRQYSHRSIPLGRPRRTKYGTIYQPF